MKQSKWFDLRRFNAHVTSFCGFTSGSTGLEAIIQSYLECCNHAAYGWSWPVPNYKQSKGKRVHLSYYVLLSLRMVEKGHEVERLKGFIDGIT